MPDYVYLEDDYKPPEAKHAPQTLLDFAEALAPIAKYYVVLLFFWYLAKRFNAAVENEADAQERQRERPTLSKELVDDSSDEDDDSEEEEEDEIYEELVTDGSRLVSVPEGETEATVRARKPLKKSEKKSKSSTKSHPLFEGLKKVEEELRQQRENEKNEGNVSWNELHKGMLKRYQQKYPEHGLRTADGDDYDDEFKELLKKHNVDINELKKEQ